MKHLFYKLWYSFGRQIIYECGEYDGEYLEIKITFKRTRDYKRYCRLKELVFTDKFYEGKTNNQSWAFLTDFVRIAEGGVVGEARPLQPMEL